MGDWCSGRVHFAILASFNVKVLDLLFCLALRLFHEEKDEQETLSQQIKISVLQKDLQAH